MIRSTAIIILITLITMPTQAQKSLGRVHSGPVRIQPEHLAKTRADIVEYAKNRRPQSELNSRLSEFGLQDFRAIFHAHAGDSAHTGGTPEELLRDAHATGLQVVFLSDHFRPPRDFMDGWRGKKEGVLFIPGSEADPFLIHPDNSVMEWMDGPRGELIPKVTQGTGMAFLSHVENVVDHPMDGVTGMEIYNRHYDAMDDTGLLLYVVQQLATPGGGEALQKLVHQYPDEFFGSQHDYPQVYIDKWDKESVNQRVVGVGANDCHHNNVYILKKKDDETALVGTNVDDDDEMRELSVSAFKGLAQVLEGHAVGDEIIRLDIDPYKVAIDNLSTHILAEQLDEPTIRNAVIAGHGYVSHDWLGDPNGFLLWVEQAGRHKGIMGDEIAYAETLTLHAQLPIKAKLRLYRNGKVVDESTAQDYVKVIEEPGTYRLEAWLDIDGEERTWIYANPVYIR